MLRVEDRELDGELDRLGREEDVRTVLENFNRRVIEARRQLLGGPPVVTKTRDIDAEVVAWHARRKAARIAARAAVAETERSDAAPRRCLRGFRRRSRDS